MKWVLLFLSVFVFADPFVLGQYAQGGVIFFLTPDRSHGLVAAITDLDEEGDGIAWGTHDFLVSSCLDGIFFAEDYHTTAGSLNTAEIFNIYGLSSPAAVACLAFSVIMEGETFDDWFVPSLAELRLMLNRKGMITATSMENGGTALKRANYWSSLENTNSKTTAFALSFDPDNPGTNTIDKTTPCRIRVIRSF